MDNTTIATVDYVTTRISDVLSPAIANGWHMYRFQMQIEGVMSICYGVGMIALLFFIYPKMKYIWNKGIFGDSIGIDIAFMLACVYALATIMFAPELIINGVMHLLNPDYYVLQSLLEVIK